MLYARTEHETKANMSDQPVEACFSSPTHPGIDDMQSIESWPSLTYSFVQSDTQQLESCTDTFRKLPADVQVEFTTYPALVKRAFEDFAQSGDSHGAVELIVEKLPAMLLRKDRYGCIPIEVAFNNANGDAARVMLKVSKDSGMLPRLLSHRSQNQETLLMLAANLNNHKFADVIQILINHDPNGIHKFYDNEGMNVFHTVAEAGFHISFDIMVDSLINIWNTTDQLSTGQIKGALEMTDRKHLTPIHYMCISEKIEMLDKLKEFLNAIHVSIDFDTCFHGPDNQTPLMIAIERDQFDVCKWLLENGSVNVHFKQHSTCLTALHFAVKRGSPRFISMLTEHGADPEYCDSTTDDMIGYKTPFDMAKTEEIPSKQECIDCLRLTLRISSAEQSLSIVELRDVTNLPSIL